VVGVPLQDHGLSEEQRDELEDMLRGLTLEREHVKRAMTFALDNAEAANDVSSAYPYSNIGTVISVQ